MVGFFQACELSGNMFTPSYDETRPTPDGSEPEHAEVHLHTYMPCWLILEALFFLIPNVAWQLFARRLGCPLSLISSRAKNLLSFTSQEVTNKALKEVAALISGYCTRNARLRKSSYVFFRCYGNLLCVGYLLLMAMHSANVIAQFFVLSSLLDIPYYRYGFEALTAQGQPLLNTTGADGTFLGLDSVGYTTFTEPISFPNVALCVLKIRRLGYIHRYTTPCALPMSGSHASLLLFIWFFLFVVACLTAIGTVIFLFEFLFGGCIGQDVTAVVSGETEKGVRHHNLTRGDHRQATMQMTDFRSSFLGRDGLFLLHTVSENAGSVITERIILELWRSYQSDQSENHG